MNEPSASFQRNFCVVSRGTLFADQLEGLQREMFS